MKKISLAIKLFAAVIFIHGVLLCFFTAAQFLFPNILESTLPEFLQEVFSVVLLLPAALLTRPFHAVLWKLGLMNAPGWFAWPKPMGVVLAYAVWLIALWVLASIARRWNLNRDSDR